MQYAVFAQGTYAESRFEQCDLKDCGFAGSDLSRVSFRESQLENIDFSGLFADESHPNSEGHALLCGQVLERLEALGWVK